MPAVTPETLKITLKMLNFRPYKRPMKLIYEGDLGYLGYFERPALCTIQVFESRYRRVVIATEIDENPGTSITNASENVAHTVEKRFNWPHVFSVHGKKDKRSVFIEHYNGDSRSRTERNGSFAIVEYHNVGVKGGWYYGRPEWTHIGRKEVESLVGRAV